MGCIKTLFRFGNGSASKSDSGQETPADGQPRLEPLGPEPSAQDPHVGLLTEPPANAQGDVQAVMLPGLHDELPGEFPEEPREEPHEEPLEEQDPQPVPTSPCPLHPHHPPEKESGDKCCSCFQSLVGCFPVPCRLTCYYYFPCCDPYPQPPIEAEGETTTASAPATS